MSGYLLNIALRGAGLYSMNSIRPRKGIFESSNIAVPLFNSIQNDKVANGPDRFHYPTERTEPANRDDPSPEKAEAHPATPGAPPDSLATHSLTDPDVEDFAAPMVSSKGKTSKTTHPESSPLLYEETQLGSHPPQQIQETIAINKTIVTNMTEKNETKKESGITSHLSIPETQSENLITALPEAKKGKGNTQNGSAISALSPANDIAEDLKRDTPTNDHNQSYVKDGQEIIKPVPPSKIKQTKISPIRQTPFSKIGSVIKKAAIQPEAKQTVKVNIGKVEVRAAQTPQPPLSPPPQAPVRKGFDDYLSVRNYGFPEY